MIIGDKINFSGENQFYNEKAATRHEKCELPRGEASIYKGHTRDHDKYPEETFPVLQIKKIYILAWNLLQQLFQTYAVHNALHNDECWLSPECRSMLPMTLQCIFLKLLSLVTSVYTLPINRGAQSVLVVFREVTAQ